MEIRGVLIQWVLMGLAARCAVQVKALDKIWNVTFAQVSFGSPTPSRCCVTFVSGNEIHEVTMDCKQEDCTDGTLIDAVTKVVSVGR